MIILTNGIWGQAGQDPATVNRDDLNSQDTLGPGTFTSALAVYSNTPADRP